MISFNLRCETLTTAQYIFGTQNKKTSRYTMNSGVFHLGGEPPVGVVFPSLVPCLGMPSLTNFRETEEELVKRVSRVSREYNSRKKDTTVILAQAWLPQLVPLQSCHAVRMDVESQVASRAKAASEGLGTSSRVKTARGSRATHPGRAAFITTHPPSHLRNHLAHPAHLHTHPLS